MMGVDFGTMDSAPARECVQLLIWLHQSGHTCHDDRESDAPPTQTHDFDGPSSLVASLEQALGPQWDQCDVNISTCNVSSVGAVCGRPPSSFPCTDNGPVQEPAPHSMLHAAGDSNNTHPVHSKGAALERDLHDCLDLPTRKPAESCVASEVLILPSPACWALGEDVEVGLELVVPAELQQEAFRLVLELNGKLLWDETYASGTTTVRCHSLQLHTTGVAHIFILPHESDVHRSISSAFAIPVLPKEAALEVVNQYQKAVLEVLGSSSSHLDDPHFCPEGSCDSHTLPLLPNQVMLPGINTKTTNKCPTSRINTAIASSPQFVSSSDTDLAADQLVPPILDTADPSVSQPAAPISDTAHSAADQLVPPILDTTDPAVRSDIARHAQVWQQSIAGIAADMGIVLAFNTSHVPADGPARTTWLQQYWTTAETLLSFMLSQGMTNTCAEIFSFMEEKGALSVCAPLFTHDETTAQGVLDGSEADACVEGDTQVGNVRERSSSAVGGSEVDACVEGEPPTGDGGETSGSAVDNADAAGEGNTQGAVTAERTGSSSCAEVSDRFQPSTPRAKGVCGLQEDGCSSHQHVYQGGARRSGAAHAVLRTPRLMHSRASRSYIFGQVDQNNVHSVTAQLICSVLLLIMSVMTGIFRQFDRVYHPSILVLPLLAAACISSGAKVKTTLRLCKSALWIVAPAASIIAPGTMEPHLDWLMPLLAHKGWILLELIWLSLSKVPKHTQLVACISDILCCTAMLCLQCRLVQYRDIAVLGLICLFSLAIPRFMRTPQSYDNLARRVEAAGCTVPEGFEQVECTILTVQDRTLSESPRRSLPDSPAMLSTAKVIRYQLLVKNPILLDPVEPSCEQATPTAYQNFQQMEATLLLGLLSSSGSQAQQPTPLPKNTTPSSLCASHADKAGDVPSPQTPPLCQDAESDPSTPPAAPHSIGPGYTWHLCRILVSTVCGLSSTPAAGSSEQAGPSACVQEGTHEEKPLSDLGGNTAVTEFSPVQLQEVRCHFWVKDVQFVERQPEYKPSATTCRFHPINCGLLLKV